MEVARNAVSAVTVLVTCVVVSVFVPPEYLEAPPESKFFHPTINNPVINETPIIEDKGGWNFWGSTKEQPTVIVEEKPSQGWSFWTPAEPVQPQPIVELVEEEKPGWSFFGNTKTPEPTPVNPPTVVVVEPEKPKVVVEDVKKEEENKWFWKTPEPEPVQPPKEEKPVYVPPPQPAKPVVVPEPSRTEKIPTEFVPRTMHIMKLLYTDPRFSHLRLGIDIFSLLVCLVLWFTCSGRRESTSTDTVPEPKLPDTRRLSTPLKEEDTSRQGEILDTVQPKPQQPQAIPQPQTIPQVVPQAVATPVSQQESLQKKDQRVESGVSLAQPAANQESIEEIRQRKLAELTRESQAYEIKAQQEVELKRQEEERTRQETERKQREEAARKRAEEVERERQDQQARDRQAREAEDLEKKRLADQARQQREAAEAERKRQEELAKQQAASQPAPATAPATTAAPATGLKPGQTHELVGRRAKYSDKLGTVRYFGEIQGTTGDWVGLEMDEPCGKNDGTLQGNVYFGPVKPLHGLFVKLPRIQLEP